MKWKTSLNEIAAELKGEANEINQTTFQNKATMFADDNSIENIQQLFFDFKKYLELQKKYTQLEVAEKLTILLSTLILVLLVVILGMVALFYLSFTLAYILDPIVGGLMVSFAMISCFHILLIAFNCCVPQKNHY